MSRIKVVRFAKSNYCWKADKVDPTKSWIFIDGEWCVISTHFYKVQRLRIRPNRKDVWKTPEKNDIAIL